MGTLELSWIGEVISPSGMVFWCVAAHPSHDGLRVLLWSSAARSHFKKLQVLQAKCFRIATNAPWYVGNTQIQDDFGAPISPTTTDPWEILLEIDFLLGTR